MRIKRFQQPGGDRVLDLSLFQRCLRNTIFIVHSSRNTKLSINVDICVCVFYGIIIISRQTRVYRRFHSAENNIIIIFTITNILYTYLYIILYICNILPTVNLYRDTSRRLNDKTTWNTPPFRNKNDSLIIRACIRKRRRRETGGQKSIKKKIFKKIERKTERHDDRVWQVHNLQVIIIIYIIVPATRVCCESSRVAPRENYSWESWASVTSKNKKKYHCMWWEFDPTHCLVYTCRTIIAQCFHFKGLSTYPFEYNIYIWYTIINWAKLCVKFRNRNWRLKTTS